MNTFSLRPRHWAVLAALAGCIGWVASQTVIPWTPQMPPLVRPDTLAHKGWPRATTPVRAYRPGEKLQYRIRYGFIEAAEATIQVKDLGHVGGRPTWQVVATGATNAAFDWVFKVRDTYRSSIDVETQLPVRFVRDIQEGDYRLLQDYRFDWSRRAVETEEHRKRAPGTAFPLPHPVHDMVSAFYAHRHQPMDHLRKGDTMVIPSIIDGEYYPLTVRFGGRQRVKTPAGQWNCLVFHPVIQKGRVWKDSDDLTVFVSDDANHIPVLVRTEIWVGAVEVELISCSGLRNPAARGL